MIDVAEVQHKQPVVGHVHVVARDEQAGHAEQVLALGVGVRPAQRGSDRGHGPVHARSGGRRWPVSSATAAPVTDGRDRAYNVLRCTI